MPNKEKEESALQQLEEVSQEELGKSLEEVQAEEDFEWDEDDDKDSYFDPNSEGEEISFICGSEEGLISLTRLICWTDPGIFRNQDRISIAYDAGGGGFNEECSDLGGYSYDIKLSYKTKALIDLTYQENSFTGFTYEYNDGAYNRRSGYTGYPESIEVEVNKPTAHESIAADTQLREWLKNKLPQEEYSRYFPEED